MICVLPKVQSRSDLQQRDCLMMGWAVLDIIGREFSLLLDFFIDFKFPQS